MTEKKTRTFTTGQIIEMIEMIDGFWNRHEIEDAVKRYLADQGFVEREEYIQDLNCLLQNESLIIEYICETPDAEEEEDNE